MHQPDSTIDARVIHDELDSLLYRSPSQHLNQGRVALTAVLILPVKVVPRPSPGAAS